MQGGGGARGEIGTMAISPTHRVIPLAVSVQNRCELVEGVG